MFSRSAYEYPQTREYWRSAHVVPVRIAAVLVGLCVDPCALRRIPMQSAGIPLRTAIWLFDAGLIEVVVALDIARVASFDQEPAADCGGPLDGACLVYRRIPVETCGCGIIARDDIVIARLEYPVHICGELVSGAHLPGQTQQYAVNLLVVDTLLACNDSVVTVGVGLSRRDVECTGNRFIDREETG